MKKTEEQKRRIETLETEVESIEQDRRENHVLKKELGGMTVAMSS